MKNTKKLLIILSAMTILAATVFAVVSGAVIAGEGTSIDEYTDMNISVSHGFEDGTSKVIFGGIANGSTANGGVGTVNNVRKSVSAMYGDDSLSMKYYYIDYYTNKNAADLYIQPKLGNLDKAEMTPENGFVSEFDIAFFSPLTVVMTEERDEDGNIVYETKSDGSLKLDSDGKPIAKMVAVTEPLLTEKLDEDGNIVYELDASGNRVLDENGNPVPEYVEVIGEDGNPVMVEKVIKGEFDGLTENLSVGMYNTYTYVDGKVDLISFSTDVKTKTIKINLGNGVYINPTAYTFNADEWCHITVQYDSKTMLTNVYVGTDDDRFDTNGDGIIDNNDEPGRLLLATKKTTYTSSDTGLTVPVYPLQFRLGCHSQTCVVGFDNFIAYQGTTIHDPTLVSGRLSYEQFIYLAQVLNTSEGEDIKHLNRYQAYNFLKNDETMQGVLNGQYGKDNEGNTIQRPSADRQAALNEALKIYKEFSEDEADKENDGPYDALVTAVKDENAELYYEYVISAYTTARTLSNFSEREALVELANEFYDSASALMNREHEKYKEAVEMLETVSAYIDGDEAAYHFISCVNIFNNSAAYGAPVARLRSHYDNAAAYYPYISTNYDGLDAESVTKIDNAKASFLAAENAIFEQGKSEGSVRFVSIMGIMETIGSGLGAYSDAMSEEEKAAWNDAYSNVNELWLRAYDIIYSGQYDPDYEGFDVAKAIYDLATEHFWNILQNEHVAIIEAKLNEYDEPDCTYIERAGICTYVDRYLETNSSYIDNDYLPLKREIARNEAYKVSLNTVVGDYKNLLVQNTTEFINVMKTALEFDTYAELKPIYDEATSYYYMMNVEGENIEKYLADYEILRLRINATEADSQAYVDIIMGNLKDADGLSLYLPLADISKKADIYKSLVAAYLCTENLDFTYPGAAEAKAIYDAKYQEYTSASETINEQIDNSENLVYSVRGNWDFDGIVAFVKKYLNIEG